jgi:hypothetical protein
MAGDDRASAIGPFGLADLTSLSVTLMRGCKSRCARHWFVDFVTTILVLATGLPVRLAWVPVALLFMVIDWLEQHPLRARDGIYWSDDTLVSLRSGVGGRGQLAPAATANTRRWRWLRGFAGGQRWRLRRYSALTDK